MSFLEALNLETEGIQGRREGVSEGGPHPRIVEPAEVECQLLNVDLRVLPKKAL